MTVAVVILNYNGRAHLERFLPSVETHSGSYRIIVADNGSTDDSVTFLKSSFPDVECIEIPQNLGYTGGYNYVLPQLKEDVFVLLNSDVEVTEGWIENACTLLDQPAIGAVQPKLLDYTYRDRFEYAGAAGGFLDMLGFPFCRGRIFQHMEVDNGQYDQSSEIFWASGACLFIKREIFITMGGFDEDFFAHMEEVDLCWRIQNAGYQIWYCAESTVYHLGGGTLSKSNPRKTYLNFRNGLNMFVKNERPGRLWWKLPLRTCFDVLAMIKFTLFDSPRDGWAIVKAHAYFWSRLPGALRKRKSAKKLWKNDHLNGIYPGSIVIAHYAGRIRKFSNLRF